MYDEITWYSMLHVCMMIITVFLVIDDDQLDGLSYTFSYGYLPHTACVWCVCVYVLFMYDISDVVKEGSCSHFLVGIYTMYHFLPLPIQFVHAQILCRLQVSVLTFLNCQDERTLSRYLNGKRGEINSSVQILTFKAICPRKLGQVSELITFRMHRMMLINDYNPLV